MILKLLIKTRTIPAKTRTPYSCLVYLFGAVPQSLFLTYISRILNLPGGAANVSALLLYVCGNGGGSLDIQLLSSQTETKKSFQKHALMYLNSACLLECLYSVL